MRLLITAGGTGGHVYPALAAASKLPPETAVRWIGSAGGMERELVTRSGIEFDAIQAGQVVGVGPFKASVGLVRLAWGTLQAIGLVLRWKPDALFVTGGYTAIPMTLACWLARVPVLVYLPDIEPGSAVKAVARLAATVAVTADESRSYFPNKHVAVTGYPVRPDVAAAARSQAQAYFHLDPARPTITVFGGSRGARSINTALLAALDGLLADCQILHITGELDWPAVKAQADRLPADRREHYQAFPYLHDDMGLALAAADLVVARAGASTLGEFPILGLGAILVPYPYAWRYQRVNADYLANRGAAVRLDDEALMTNLTATIRDLLGTPNRLEAMRAAARALAVPDADQRIARELVQLMAAHSPGGKRP